MNKNFEKIHCLVKYLNDCSKLYEEGKSPISDEEWDKLYFELDELEKSTGLILNNSPTQKIIYEVKNELEKRTHNHKMLSLEKTKSVSEVKNFLGNQTFLAMCKMDGLTCSLTYKGGELVAAETRGDGFVGEDILHNIKTLPSVPHRIPYKDEIVIDGEIICTYKDFEPFKEEYKNPRNFAAGSIRLLDSKECQKRNLTFVVWEVIKGFEYIKNCYLEYLFDIMRFLGFTVVPHIVSNMDIANDDYTIENLIEEIKNQAKENSYPIDGVVFKFSDIEYGKSLGETSHHFKNALAFKFADESYPSTLLDIEWTMGRTGVLTPIAVFEPIDIDGSTVSRASLHNISIMHELSGGFERIGDIVHIFKANQIIPQVSEWEHTGDYSDERHLSIPEVCPICGQPTKIKMDNNSKILVCPNSLCSGKLINRLDHFCGKKGLDIKGISKATLEKLIDWGWVSNPKDLFTLKDHRDEWIKKPGFGVKSVDKVLNNIADSTTSCELNQFISALGIPLIGATAAKDLTKVFKTWEDFIFAVNNKYAFYQLPNFGSEMHYALHNFDYEEAIFIVDNYLKINKEKIEENKEENIELLKNKVFVITGKLAHFKNRDEIKNKIESLGGKVTGSVSKNTNYLINNDKNSETSKNKTAKTLGVAIISEEDFLKMIGSF